MLMDTLSKLKYLGLYILTKCGLARPLVLNLEAPSLSEAKIELLKSYFQDGGILLEYGAGGSTRYFAKYLDKIITVETDKRFLDAATRELDNVIPHYVDIGPTWQWGFPLFPLPKWLLMKLGKKYVNQVWSCHADLLDKLDFVFVDGRFRAATVLAMFRRELTSSPLIFLDDFHGRAEYNDLLTVADIVAEADTLVVLQRKPAAKNSDILQLQNRHYAFAI